MPPWGPIKRRVLIAALRKLGFDGPFSGGKHEFMVRGDVVLTIPNPHREDVGPELLGLVLRQGGISRRNGSACEPAGDISAIQHSARLLSASPLIGDRQVAWNAPE